MPVVSQTQTALPANADMRTAANWARSVPSISLHSLLLQTPPGLTGTLVNGVAVPGTLAPAQRANLEAKPEAAAIPLPPDSQPPVAAKVARAIPGSGASLDLAALAPNETPMHPEATAVTGTERRLDIERMIKKRIERLNHDYAPYRYADAGISARNILRQLGPRFDELLVDPGLVLRIEAFADFVRANRLNDANPWRARLLFSSSLGARTVYRALALTDEERQNILRAGIFSTLALKTRGLVRRDLPKLPFLGAPADLFRDFDGGKGSAKLHIGMDGEEFVLKRYVLETPPGIFPIAKAFDLKLSALLIESPVLSVAEKPEIALAAAKPYLGNNPGKQLVLFELEVPELDLLYPQNEHEPHAVVANKSAGSLIRITNPEGNHTTYTYGREAESFLLHWIGPDEIRSWQITTERYAYEFPKAINRE